MKAASAHRLTEGRRGHILALLMVGIVAIGLLLAGTSARVGQRTEARPADDVRRQAIWLARSALNRGWTGARTVETPHGRASVEAEPGLVTVSMGGGTARVTLTEQRFTPTGR